MKLVLFSFALLCGILLIHAEGTGNQGDASSASTSHGKDPKAPDSAAHSPETKSQDPKTGLDPTGSKSSGSQHVNAAPADSSIIQPGPKPTPTPSPAPSPTPSPTPYPAGAGKWNVTETNVTCIMVSGIIKLTTVLKNYSGLNETREIALGPQTPANGSCSDFHIRWYLDSLNSTLQFQFSVNASTKEVSLSQVDGKVIFPHPEPKGDVAVGFQNASLHAFEAPLNKSYFCGKTIKLVIKNDSNKTITVELDNFQIQAGKFTKTGKFDEDIDGCPSHNGGGPDVIPIIVGCMLAVLVVVVLVAYLINRRRSQAHGYLSM